MKIKLEASIEVNDTTYKIDFANPLDISVPLKSGIDNPLAWYIEPPKIFPVVLGDWTGKVSLGASTNFNSITFNPHAHGTHTECVGHITKKFYSINECLTTFMFVAQVVSVKPKAIDGDLVIQTDEFSKLDFTEMEAIIIRTLPNLENKKSLNYSNTNPPYMSKDAVEYLKQRGIKHLLIDLPSVDKEKDKGELIGHNVFWNTNGNIRFDATITELIYVPNTIKDGIYLLNLQIASFHNDASPSKPVLYKLI